MALHVSSRDNSENDLAVIERFVFATLIVLIKTLSNNLTAYGPLRFAILRNITGIARIGSTLTNMSARGTNAG
jgi:hypothetical protein